MFEMIVRILYLHCLFSEYITYGKTVNDELNLEIKTVGDLYEDDIFISECSWSEEKPPCDTIDYIYYEKKVDLVWENALKINKDSSVETYELGDYTLGDRAESNVLEPAYRAVFNDVILEDSGLWRCKIDQCDTQYSDAIEFYVSTKLEPSDISITVGPPGYILLGSSSMLSCISDRVYPRVDMYWNIIGEDIDNTTTDYQPNGAAWTLTNINQFTFYDQLDVKIKCIVDKNTGYFQWSVNNTASNLRIYAPAVINGSSVLPFTPKLTDTLKLICIASGTDVVVKWKRNNIYIDEELFTIDVQNITGDFHFGQKVAMEVTATWKPPNENDGCGVINKHDGNYHCEAIATQGPVDESDKYTVKVNYPPILEKPDEEVFYRIVGEQVTLTCVFECGEPIDVTYTWTSENDRDISDTDSDTLSFAVDKEDYNVTFKCHVNNTAGYVTKSFTIFEIVTTTQATTEPPTEPIYTYTDGNITSPTDDPGSDQRHALIIANAVIWSLCGVVGVVLVCLSIYHYRQIQNGKKRHEYSDNTPLTEDEAKPGSSNITSEYADIGLAGAIGGACRPVSGLHTEDLYAEVQNPAQIPVAPKRTSKEKAHQPQHGTPKIKPNQSPAVPNSPLNTLRQEPNKQIPDRRPEPAADYSPSNKCKEMPPKHSNAVKYDTGANVDERHRKESPNQQVVVKPNTNGAKPTVSAKPNITSFRSSRSSSGGLTGQGKNPEGPNYNNSEVNIYANCEQHQVPKNSDETITYADLALQQEDPYDEGAPPVPQKHMNDQEPVQYASIKRNK